MTTATPEGRPDPATFLSGESGTVGGVRRSARAIAGDLALDVRLRLARTGRALDRAAATLPEREVLVVSVYRPGTEQLAAAARELRRSRHRVGLAFGSTGEPDSALASETVADGLTGGKFENVNAIVRAVLPGPRPAPDWLIVLDDDVALPERFLDRFLGACEAVGFELAQPAQTLRSHAAWRVTRRRGGSLARETRFVEIGPVTAFSRVAQEALMPFPDLRYGWGLDSHWGALAAERGWRIGVVDALPVRHESRPVATSYGHADAVEEATSFLTGRAYVPTPEAQETVATHRELSGPTGPSSTDAWPG